MIFHLYEKIKENEFRCYIGKNNFEETLKFPWKDSESLTREILYSCEYTNSLQRIAIQKRNGSFITIYHIDKFYKNLYIDHIEYENYNLAEEDCKYLNIKFRRYKFELRKNILL